MLALVERLFSGPLFLWSSVVKIDFSSRSGAKRQSAHSWPQSHTIRGEAMLDLCVNHGKSAWPLPGGFNERRAGHWLSGICLRVFLEKGLVTWSDGQNEDFWFITRF